MIKTIPATSTTKEPYQLLGLAIIERAVLDYTEAIKSNDSCQINELEKFFKSEWAMSLSEIDTVVLMRKVRKMTKEVVV